MWPEASKCIYMYTVIVQQDTVYIKPINNCTNVRFLHVNATYIYYVNTYMYMYVEKNIYM